MEKTDGSEDTVIKMKGFRLTHDSKKYLTFENIQKMAFAYYSDDPFEISVSGPQLYKSLGKISTRQQKKRLRTVMDKVRTMETISAPVRPYGYMSGEPSLLPTHKFYSFAFKSTFLEKFYRFSRKIFLSQVLFVYSLSNVEISVSDNNASFRNRP